MNTKQMMFSGGLMSVLSALTLCFMIKEKIIYGDWAFIIAFSILALIPSGYIYIMQKLGKFK